MSLEPDHREESYSELNAQGTRDLIQKFMDQAILSNTPESFEFCILMSGHQVQDKSGTQVGLMVAGDQKAVALGLHRLIGSLISRDPSFMKTFFEVITNQALEPTNEEASKAAQEVAALLGKHKLN